MVEEIKERFYVDELAEEKVESVLFFFFKQKTAYEIGTGDWSSDVCSSDLPVAVDGEVDEFMLWDLDQVLDNILDGRFKPNVVIDRKSVV